MKKLNKVYLLGTKIASTVAAGGASTRSAVYVSAGSFAVSRKTNAIATHTVDANSIAAGSTDSR